MRVKALLLTAALAAAVAAESPSNEVTPERIAKLVAQLGSARFANRESAMKALDAIGEPALDSLRIASTSADAETRRRANDLVDRIARRSSVARILKPTQVALDIRDKPLNEAVKELAKATGMNVELPQPAKFAGRRLTIKCEPLPVWQAIELFCRKADLHDWDGHSPQSGQPAPAAAVQNNIAFGGQGQIVFAGRSGRVNPRTDGKVVLLDGAGAALPSHHAGAIRIRALPPGTPFPYALMAGEVVLPLQISAEQRLQWAGAVGIRIDKAVNDSGQPLAATGVVVPTSSDDDMEWIQMPNGGMMVQPAAGKGGPTAVRVVRGDKSSTRIAELSGEVTGSVRVKEEMVRLDGPFKTGAAVTGTNGAAVKLLSVADEKPGEIKLTIELSTPPEADATGMGRINGRVQIQGVVMQQVVVGGARNVASNLAAGTTEFQGLALEDSQGRRWTAIGGLTESARIGPQGTTTQLVMTLKAPASDSQAARLIYSGSRPVVVSIPFVIRDLPLS